MDSTEFHAMFHEAATRGWDEHEFRQLARMWAEDGGHQEPPHRRDGQGPRPLGAPPKDLGYSHAERCGKPE